MLIGLQNKYVSSPNDKFGKNIKDSLLKNDFNKLIVNGSILKYNNISSTISQ